MTLAAAVNGITVDGSAGMLAMVTLTAAVVLGLATLARPSPPTIIWGLAFGVGLLGTYLWVAGGQREDDTLRAVGSAFLVSFAPLTWFGLRMFFRRVAPWWPAVLFLIVVPVALGALAGTAAYPIAFRVAFVAGGGFAALIAVELLRGQVGRRDVVLPLVLASCVFTIVSVLAALGLLLPEFVPAAPAQLGILREVNGIGIPLVSVCAAFTLVLLVRSDAATGPADDAAERMRRRLSKAKSLRDPAWSLLDIRLDDPDDLRQAWTGSTYARIVEAFHDAVIDELPPTAEADRVSDEQVLVLIRDSKEAVQQMLRALLARVSSVSDEDPALAMRFSASVGWAPAMPAGYDYDTLLVQAAGAVERARVKGGDCWERLGSAAASQ